MKQDANIINKLLIKINEVIILILPNFNYFIREISYHKQSFEQRLHVVRKHKYIKIINFV